MLVAEVTGGRSGKIAWCILRPLFVSLSFFVHFNQLENATFSFVTSLRLSENLHYSHTVLVTNVANTRWFLWDENLSPGLGCDVLDSLALLTDDEPNVFVGHFDSAVRLAKRTVLTDVNTHLALLRVLIDHSFDSLLGKDILFVVCLDEYVTYIGVLDLTFGNLDFGATFILQSTNRLAIFADDESYSIVWNRDDVS